MDTQIAKCEMWAQKLFLKYSIDELVKVLEVKNSTYVYI